MMNIEIIKSKHGPTYKVKITGNKIEGESLPFYPNLEKLNLTLVQKILRLFRSDGSGRDVPFGARMKCEKVVLTELKKHFGWKNTKP